MSIYLYRDYRTFLKDFLKRKGRGSQSSLALAIQCTKGFLSQVLSEKMNFNTEQGFLCAQWLKLDSKATRFFLLLIRYQGASSSELKSFLKKEIDHIAQKKSGVTAFDQEEEQRLLQAYRQEFYSG